MPIEHETKHVLDHRGGALIAELAADGRFDRLEIEQGYATPLNRFRRVRERGCDEFEYVTTLHTFKLPTSAGILEIENEVSQEDFELGMSVATRSVRKIRYSRRCYDGRWDVDFLFEGAPGVGLPYVAVAEWEADRGTPPDFTDYPFAGDVILVVPEEDGAMWSNSALSDVSYASAMLDGIRPK